jgi:hypothetical protein
VRCTRRAGDRRAPLVLSSAGAALCGEQGRASWTNHRRCWVWERSSASGGSALDLGHGIGGAASAVTPSGGTAVCWMLHGARWILQSTKRARSGAFTAGGRIVRWPSSRSRTTVVLNGVLPPSQTTLTVSTALRRGRRHREQPRVAAEVDGERHRQFRHCRRHGTCAVVQCRTLISTVRGTRQLRWSRNPPRRCRQPNAAGPPPQRAPSARRLGIARSRAPNDSLSVTST